MVSPSSTIPSFDLWNLLWTRLSRVKHLSVFFLRTVRKTFSLSLNLSPSLAFPDSPYEIPLPFPERFPNSLVVPKYSGLQSIRPIWRNTLSSAFGVFFTQKWLSHFLQYAPHPILNHHWFLLVLEEVVPSQDESSVDMVLTEMHETLGGSSTMAIFPMWMLCFLVSTIL